MSERRQAILRVLAVAYLLVVLLATLWPSGDDVSGVKDTLGLWFLSAEAKDVLLNLGMLVPLSLLAVLAWPRVPWWAWALAACLLSAGVELTQLLAPVLSRRGSALNVLENSAGAWVGALAAFWLSRRRRRRATPADGRS